MVKSDKKKMTLTNSTQNKLLQERINAVEKQNTAMKLDMNRLNVKVGSRVRITNNEGLTTLRKENERLKSSVLDLQCQAMGANLVFTGIVEKKDENLENTNKNFIKDMLKIECEIELGKFYRLGKEAEGKIRPIVASFSKMRDWQGVRYAALRHLIGKPFGVYEHFPPEVIKIRRELIPIHKEARKQKIKSVLKRDKLFIENEPFD
jgi:co-chaperonin GroES (HSP10)